jgi:hypothetical protein
MIKSICCFKLKEGMVKGRDSISVESEVNCVVFQAVEYPRHYLELMEVLLTKKTKKPRLSM